jgi:hypothetical protein
VYAGVSTICLSISCPLTLVSTPLATHTIHYIHPHLHAGDTIWIDHALSRSRCKRQDKGRNTCPILCLISAGLRLLNTPPTFFLCLTLPLPLLPLLSLSHSCLSGLFCFLALFLLSYLSLLVCLVGGHDPPACAQHQHLCNTSVTPL